MKRFANILLIGILLLLASCINDGLVTSDKTTLVKVGEKAPDFTTQLYPSGSVRLSSLQGKVVLLTLWDPECSMCRYEMAVVQEKILDRIQSYDFYYLPIARGQDYEPIKGFFLDNGYTFSTGLDPKREIYKLYATMYVPRSFIIDKQGVIRHIYVEYELDKLDTIVSTVEQMLK
ncbi:MAG: TlpA family protein disulfide reductase [Alistipes sp.]|nr:TlpA family protein disulfide reductase [Alistipes sp.]